MAAATAWNRPVRKNCGWWLALLVTWNGFFPWTTACAETTDWSYTTRPGDTLWNISHAYLKNPDDWLKLQQYNRIERPKRLPPGTKLRVPVAWLKSQPIPANIVFVRGDVAVVLPSSGKTTAQPGQQLELGSRIITQADSSASLRFGDGSSLIVQASSELILDTITIHAQQGMVDAHMRLQRGRVESEVTPFSRPDSRYEITTPAAVAAVRGTRFRLAVDTSGEQLRNETTDGAVAVTSAGTTRDVPAGFGTLAKPATPPIPPKPLLAPPQWATSAHTYYRSQITMEWQPLAAAVQYRLQLAKDRQFRELLHELTTNQTRAALPALPDGAYFLRLRGVDDIGLEGRDAVLDLNVAAQLAPAELTTPPPHETLREAPLHFTWTSVQGAAQYRLQLAGKNDFSAPAVDILTAAPSVTLDQTLAVGAYDWRVIAINDEGTPGMASTVGHFQRAQQVSAPAGLNALVAETSVTLQWERNDGIDHYQLDVARNSAFVDKERSELVQTNMLTLSDLPAGDYYWRVRGVADDKHAGDYSSGRFVVTPPSRWWLWLLLLPLVIAP